MPVAIVETRIMCVCVCVRMYVCMYAYMYVCILCCSITAGDPFVVTVET